MPFGALIMSFRTINMSFWTLNHVLGDTNNVLHQDTTYVLRDTKNIPQDIQKIIPQNTSNENNDSDTDHNTGNTNKIYQEKHTMNESCCDNDAVKQILVMTIVNCSGLKAALKAVPESVNVPIELDSENYFRFRSSTRQSVKSKRMFRSRELSRTSLKKILKSLKNKKL